MAPRKADAGKPGQTGQPGGQPTRHEHAEQQGRAHAQEGDALEHAQRTGFHASDRLQRHGDGHQRETDQREQQVQTPGVMRQPMHSVNGLHASQFADYDVASPAPPDRR